MAVEWNSWKRAKEGTWCCRYCSVIFPTRNKLLEHYHTHSEYKRIDRQNNDWRCEYCEEKFKTRKLLFLHLKECQEKKKLPHDSKGRVIKTERFLKQGQTYKKHYTEGKFKIWNDGKKETSEHRAKIAEGTKRYLDSHGKLFGARFSETACSYIDKLNEQNHWHLQHALNGGEITCGPYYLDGYDKELNIAFEYDEPAHYSNVTKNQLNERDEIRMKFIKEKLNCRFFRYNEKLNLLYEC